LKAISQVFDKQSKLVTLTMGVNDALMRHVEMPIMRWMPCGWYENNSRVYLQQTMTGYVFDCVTAANRSRTNPPGSSKGTGKQRC